MKRILLACFALAAIVVLFQNCSVPNTGSMGSSNSSSTADTTTTASVAGPLAITSLSTQVYSGDQVQLMSSGGTPPYQYSILEGDGQIDQTTGIYTAASTSGSVTIQLMDSLSASVSITLNVGQIVWTAANYMLIPVHRSLKAVYYNIYTTDLTEAKALTGYVYKGIVFNVFQAALSPTPLYECYSSSLTEYFLSNYTDCGGATRMKFLGYLESVATSIVVTPVYRCVRTSGKLTHLTTLTPTTDCTTAKGYKAEGVLGYTM